MRAALIEVKNGKSTIIGKGIDEGKLTDVTTGDETTTFTSATDFFDHVFKALPNLEKMLRGNTEAALSIVFSFPGIPKEVEGGSLDAYVPYLTKGFVIPGLDKNNFMPVLNQYLKAKELGEKQQIIFNDTPILVSGDANIGLVVGTGYNFAVKMKAGRLREIKGSDFAPGWDNSDEMLVDIEAGGIDQVAGLIYQEAAERGQSDKSIVSMIDAALSLDERGKQMDEKLVSGKYKGLELQEILFMLKRQNLIQTEISAPGREENWWKAEDFSAILNNIWDGDKVSADVKGILPADRTVVKEVCEIIRDQAAQIIACHLAGAAKVTGDRSVVAIAEGSLFWLTPGFKDKVVEYLKQLGIDSVEFTRAGEEGDHAASMKRGAIAGINYIEIHTPRERAIMVKKQIPVEGEVLTVSEVFSQAYQLQGGLALIRKETVQVAEDGGRGAWKIPKNQEIEEGIRLALIALQNLNELLHGELSEKDRFDLRGASTLLIGELKNWGLTDEMLGDSSISTAASNPLTAGEFISKMNIFN